jgi:hypothetical protein
VPPGAGMAGRSATVSGSSVFECVAFLPDRTRVHVEAIADDRGARLLRAYRGVGSARRDVLPRLTDHARRMLRDQVETAMVADRAEARDC